MAAAGAGAAYGAGAARVPARRGGDGPGDIRSSRRRSSFLAQQSTNAEPLGRPRDRLSRLRRGRHQSHLLQRARPWSASTSSSLNLWSSWTRRKSPVPLLAGQLERSGQCLDVPHAPGRAVPQWSGSAWRRTWWPATRPCWRANNPYAARLSLIESMTATDAYTLQVTAPLYRHDYALCHDLPGHGAQHASPTRCRAAPAPTGTSPMRPASPCVWSATPCGGSSSRTSKGVVARCYYSHGRGAGGVADRRDRRLFHALLFRGLQPPPEQRHHHGLSHRQL